MSQLPDPRPPMSHDRGNGIAIAEPGSVQQQADEDLKALQQTTARLVKASRALSPDARRQACASLSPEASIRRPLAKL